MDWDDFYAEAEDNLRHELERAPTPGEIAKEAQDLYEFACCAAYDFMRDDDRE